MRLLLKTAFALLLLTLMLASGFELWQRHRDILPLDRGLDEKAQTLLANNRPAEAQMLAVFVLEHPDTGDPVHAKAIAGESARQMNATARKFRQFAKGALSGQPDDMASFLGSLSLDLFVVGDIRDLAVQGWKQWSDGDGDAFIMALSAAGLAAALAPEIHWAPSMMKAFKRTGALSQPFVASMKTTGKQALKTRKFGALADVLKDFGKAGRKLGPGPLGAVMRNVDSAAELKKISKAAAIDPKAAYAVATLGKNGVKAIGKEGKNIGKLAGKIRVLSRAAKISKKALGAIPDWLLATTMLISLGLLLRLCRRCQSKRFRQAITRFAKTDAA